MALTLNNFCKEIQKNLEGFQKWWEIMHKENPSQYPMEMLDGNEGLWLEQFLEFDPAWLTENKSAKPKSRAKP